MDDDELIVIIVGDQGEGCEDFPRPIKNETDDALDESNLDLNSILETAELHGQHISVKDKEYYDYEYLEDTEEQNKIVPEKPAKAKGCYSKSLKNSEKNKVPKKRRIKSPTLASDEDDDSAPPKNQMSYVAKLRKNFPKMRKDDNYLISHLVDLMKSTKAPSPPIDFCLTEGARLVCAYCRAENPNLPSACRHYQKIHGPRIFVCYACGRNFRCTTGLYKHEKHCTAPGVHLVLKARGEYLGRKGRNRPYLTLNRFDPGGLNPAETLKKGHFCSLCTASFKHKEALQSHEHMHRGIRPFQCEKCPMAYTSIVALKRHLNTHTGAEYICDTCNRSFKVKGTLIVHMNTHLPQRKYPCEYCARRFAQKSALRSHIDSAHLNIPPPLACAACPKRFPRMSNLKAHMKARHGLTVMSRRMFLKALPSMKETEEIKQATIVFNQSNINILNEQSKGIVAQPIHNDTTQNTDIKDVQKYNTIQHFVKTFDGESTELSSVDSVEDLEVLNNKQYERDTFEKDLNHADIKLKVYTPKKPVITTSLPETCELEFMRFVASKGECDTVIKTNKTKRHLTPRIDLSMVRSSRAKIKIDVQSKDANINDVQNDKSKIVDEHDNMIGINTNKAQETRMIVQRAIVKKTR